MKNSVVIAKFLSFLPKLFIINKRTIACIYRSNNNIYIIDIIEKTIKKIESNINHHFISFVNINYYINKIVYGTRTGNIDLYNYDYEHNKIYFFKKFIGHTSKISFIVFNKDDTKIISISIDTTVKIWEIESGNLLNTIEFFPIQHEYPWCIAPKARRRSPDWLKQQQPDAPTFV